MKKQIFSYIYVKCFTLSKGIFPFPAGIANFKDVFFFLTAIRMSILFSNYKAREGDVQLVQAGTAKMTRPTNNRLIWAHGTTC